MMNSYRVQLMVLMLGVAAASSASALNPYSPSAGESYRKLPDAKKGGALNIHTLSNPKVLNPLLVTDIDFADALPWVFSQLMQVDEETGEYTPLLAEKLDVTKDRKTLTYTLRKEAVWEDGTPVTTDDAEFTFNTLMDTKTEAAPQRAYFEGYTFEKVDAHTFKFHVAKPNVNTVDFANDSFQIIQKKQYAGVPNFNKAKGIIEPIGNGPMKLKIFSRDQKVEFERVKNWWGYQIPELKNLYNFDTIAMRIIPDPSLAYERLIKGDLDVLYMNAETYGFRVRTNDKDKFGKDSSTDKALWADHFKTKGPAQWQYVGWNNLKPLFQSKKTRQALAHLVNYEEIISKVYYGEGIRSVSPFGSLTPNTAPDQKSKAFDYSIQKGVQELKDDGWADVDHDGTIAKTIDGKKVKFEFTLRYNSENPLRGKMAQIIKEDFKKAGIKVNVQAVEFNTLLNYVDTHDYDAVLLSWGNGMLHSDSKQIWYSKSSENKGSNFVSYNNPEVDKLIEQATSELDGDKHFKLNQKIGAMIYDDQPYAFVVEIPGFMAGFQTRKVASKKWVQKYDMKPAYRMYYAP